MDTKDIEIKEQTYGSLPTHVERYKPRVREHLLPIVLVHGAWVGSWMWKKYATFLAEKGWDVYALDLRGHGKSGGDIEEASMEDYVRDIHTVILEGLLGSSVVIGHSMGGLAALMYGTEYDPAAVIAIDPTLPKETKEKSETREYPLTYMPEDTTNERPEVPDLSDEDKKFVKKNMTPESGKAWKEREEGISISRSKLPKSTLFIGSELKSIGSNIEDMRELATYYKKDVVEIPGASHPGVLIGENWKIGAAAIDEWLTIQFEADFSDLEIDPFDIL